MKTVHRFGMGAARMRLLAFTTLGALITAGVALPANAQTPARAAADSSLTAQHDFDLPAQPLARSITQVASIAGLQVLYSDDMAAGKQAPALSGRMSAQQALERLVGGSGYALRVTSDRVVTLVKASAEGNVDGEKVTGAVRVEGAIGSPYFGGTGQAAGVNGVNGSRDITATEGTGGFTSGALTIGSKVPQALKDVPQSISVLTSERMEQQNVTDFTTALKQLPGVTLVQGDSGLENKFYSRGFAITSIQVDGGAPLSTAWGYYPQIDMAQYDHVELLRGAAGTFNGYGDPSGTVNLVRKKPLDHSQFVLEGQTGSWSNYRIVADATSPLAFDGKLRGRLVMSYQDNHYFYDIAKDKKMLLYGIVEADLTPSTLLTAGISYTRQDSVPWYLGLPRYQTGADLQLPRSTALAFPWNRWNFDTTEIFGSIEQKIGDDWTLKINLTHNNQSSTKKLGYSQGSVNPLTDAGPLLTGVYNDYASKQFSAEATLIGAFEIFGQRQEIAIGANRTDSDGGGQTSYASLTSGSSAAPYQPYPGGPTYYFGSPNGQRPPINVFAFNPLDPLYTEPRNSLPSSRYSEYGQIQSVAYANLRLTAFDRLHLTTGLRWSRYEYKIAQVGLCTSIPSSGTPAPDSCVGRNIGDSYSPYGAASSGNDISWPPAVSLSYDVTKTLTAYVGYTDIYQNQASYLDPDLKPIDPITGSNIEGGLKWQARNGRLNLSIAAYRIKQKGFPVEDGTYDYDVTSNDIVNGINYYFVASNGRRVPNGLVDPDHNCCYKADPSRTLESEGFDLEVTGELLIGWQVSAGYTYNRTKQEGSYFGTNDGLPFVSIQPKSLYKLWSSFDFGAAGNGGWLAGLTLSGGVNGQSSGYQSGTACVNLNPPNALGVSTCKSSNLPDTVPYSFTVPAYAVFAGRIDYRVSSKWSVAINLENILDKTYYQTTGTGPTSGNWYGAPRSVTVSLHAKW